MLERESEQERLVGLVDRARRGAGGTVVVEGPAGIGKTELLAATRAAAADLVVGSAVGASLEHDLSFGVVRQLFDRLVREAVDPGALFEGAAAPAAQLFGLGAPQVGHGPGDTLHGLYWLTVALAEAGGPLVLLCDDAHWYDPPSLRFVAYLAARVAELPVAIVIGTRPPPPGPDGELLDWVLRQPWVSRLRPRPLGTSSIATLADVALRGTPDRPFCDAVEQITGGNPFLIGELLRAAARDGLAPTEGSVARLSAIDPEDVVLSRLGRLPADALEVARSVAVLGADAHVRHIATLTGLSIDAVGAAADTLQRANVVGPDRPLSFSHPLVAAAIYRELLPGDRSRRHRAAARALAAEQMSPSRIGHHLMHAEPAGDPEVVDVLVESARAAFAEGATDVAVAQLRRALDEPPPPERRPDLVYRLGVAESFFLDPRAVDHLREAAAVVPDPQARISLTTARAVALCMHGRPAAGAAALRELAGELPATAELHRSLLGGFGFVAATGPTAAQEVAAEARALVDAVRDVDDATPPLVLGVGAYLAAMAGERPEVVQACAARALATVSDDDPMLPIWFHMAAAALVTVDHDADALAIIDGRITAARRRGAPGQVGMALFVRSLIAFRAGELADAATDAGGVLEIAVAHGIDHLVPASLAIAVDVHRELDELDEAEELLARHGYATGDGDSVFHLFLLHARARLHGARQRWTECFDDLRRGQQRAASTLITSPGFIPWTSELAVAHYLAGRPSEARQLAIAALAEADRHHSRRATLEARRVLAMVDGDDATIEEVLAGYAELGASLEQARTTIGYTLSPAIVGTPREPELVADGLRLAEHCGATRLAAMARTTLRALGAGPARPLSGIGALTASERRVASLAAAGRTNKQVAQELYVTVKTVETHLSRCYQKLAIGSRVELRELISTAPSS